MESRFALRAADDTFDRRCADINECATGNGGCWSGNITEMFDDLGTFNNETGSTTTFMSSTCINYPGGSDCTDCPPGTVGDPLVLCLSVSLSAGIPDLARTQLTLQPVLVAGQANRFSLKLFDAIGAQVGPRSPVENLPVKLRLAFDGPAGTYTALATNDDGAIDSFVDMITLPNVTGTYTVTVSMSVFNQTTYNASADALIKSICWEDARWPANATEQSPQNVSVASRIVSAGPTPPPRTALSRSFWSATLVRMSRTATTCCGTLHWTTLSSSCRSPTPSSPARLRP